MGRAFSSRQARRQIAYVHDRPGEPCTFNISQIKPFVNFKAPEDIFVSVNKVLNSFRLNQGDSDNSVIDIIVTKMIERGDPLENSLAMQRAKEKELLGLLDRGTFTLVLCSVVPKGSNLLSARFVLAIKDPGTHQEVYKALLVARGFQDKLKSYIVHEINTVRSSSFRILMAVASLCGFTVWSEDVMQAFLR
jgi:hypothetical protein